MVIDTTRWPLKFYMLVLSLVISFACFAQEGMVPQYKVEATQPEPGCNFNCFIERSFRSLYVKYFKNACGNYYHVVKFNIDDNGNVKNLSFDNPSSFMTQFIGEALRSTNGNWRLIQQSGIKDSSKLIILPIYFYFNDRCDIKVPNSIHYYSVPEKENGKPVLIRGYTLLKEENNSILLWPVKLKGDSIFRDLFLKTPVSE